jgi:hypothetical protein
MSYMLAICVLRLAWFYLPCSARVPGQGVCGIAYGMGTRLQRNRTSLDVQVLQSGILLKVLSSAGAMFGYSSSQAGHSYFSRKWSLVFT